MKTKYIISLFIALILRGGISYAQNEIFVDNESELNTPFHEYCPTAFANGVVFITSNPAFTIGHDNEDYNSYKFTSTLLARRDTLNQLQKPIAFVADASPRHSYGPLCFDKDIRKAFFTRSHVKGSKQLYMVEMTRQGWSSAVKLPFNSSEFDCAHPTISADGKKLYFASNAPNGFGGWDVYVSTYINGEWSNAVNLGPSINTSDNEFFPYISTDNKLYFSSDRKKGCGGLDIYRSEKSDNHWRVPTHLPKPINSSADDFGILINGDKKSGYFTSNRAKSKGEDDIFSFTCTMTIDDPIFEEAEEQIIASTEGGDAMEAAPQLSQIIPKHIAYKIVIDTPLLKWVVPALESKPLYSIAEKEKVILPTPSVFPKEIEIETPTFTAKSVTSVRKGKYLVIVGTYSEKENALIQKKKMEAKGFDTVEVVQYSDTRMYGVCVQRFEVEKAAFDFAHGVVNDKKVDAFVKIYR